MHLSGKEIFKNEYNSEFFDPHLCCFTAWCTKPFHKSLLQLIFFSSKTRIPVSLSDWQMNVWLSLSRKLHKSSCSNSSDVFVWGFESPRTRPNNVARYINFNLLESSITVASILHCYYCLCVCIYALFCFYLKTTKLKLFIFYASNCLSSSIFLRSFTEDIKSWLALLTLIRPKLLSRVGWGFPGVPPGVCWELQEMTYDELSSMFLF